MGDIRRRDFITLLSGAAVGWPLATFDPQGRQQLAVGLRPEPDCRPRRALLHLSYSYAPSYRRRS
jgi:hypothetical protein